jgi:hypothetical protein
MVFLSKLNLSRGVSVGVSPLRVVGRPHPKVLSLQDVTAESSNPRASTKNLFG